MKVSALNQINHKLKNIPDNFANDIITYLDYLSFKAGTKNWASDLSPKELELVKRGAEDVKNGTTFTNMQAIEKINAHIKRKHK